MLRASRPLLAPVRTAAAHKNHGRLAPLLGRTAVLPLSRDATSQSHPTHSRIQSRVPPFAFTPATSSSKRLLVSYSTKSRPPVELKIDHEHEKKLGQEKIEPRPGEVTLESSRRHMTEPYESPHEEPPVMNSVKADMNSIQEALALTTVPRETYALGLGGTIPYFITSLSTVYLGWNLRHSYPTSSPIMNTFMVSHETAHQWLQMIEPIQLGYGAVIISFLGAVHWGMEFNEKTPSHDRARFRYTMGVLAPAIAWPTLFLPIHFALTGQFLAFTLLYFADSRATKLGWVPPWYATYRFVLTFIVGSAILVSLIFRAKIDDAGENMTERLKKGMHQRGSIEEDYTEKWAKLEREDKEKAKKEEEEKKKKEKKEKEKNKDKAEEKPESDEKSADGEKEEEDNAGDGDENSRDEKEDENSEGKEKNDEKESDANKKDEKKTDDSGDKTGDDTDDDSKGDEKKDAVDGDSSSKKKSSKGDEKSKGKGGKGGK